MLRFLGILLTLALAALGLAGPLSPTQARALDRALALYRADAEIPGLSAAIILEGEIAWVGSDGLSDLENRVPALPETAYRTASIAKPITAVMLLRLVEAGRLDLDAPIETYLPDFPAKQWPVTTRHLLAHTAGIRGYQGEEWASARRYESLREAVEVFWASPLLHEPGTAYLYSTYGTCLAGLVGEAAGGSDFMQLVRRLVLSPAGMAATRDDDARALIPHRAQGYRRVLGGVLENSILVDVSNKVPGGGMISTAPDLARFLIALLDDTLLTGPSRRAAWADTTLANGEKTGYGLCFDVGEWEGHFSVGHGGAQPRVTHRMRLLPEERAGVVVLTNLEGSRASDIADDLLRLAMILPAE